MPENASTGMRSHVDVHPRLGRAPAVDLPQRLRPAPVGIKTPTLLTRRGAVP